MGFLGSVRNTVCLDDSWHRNYRSAPKDLANFISEAEKSVDMLLINEQRWLETPELEQDRKSVV